MTARHTAASLPPNIVERLNPKDRKALGLESSDERGERIAVELERDLQRLCEAYLRQLEVEFLHLSPRAREKEGWPDLVFAIDGKAFAVELKTSTGVVSQAQRECLERLKRNGWTVAVCRSFYEFRLTIKGNMT